jgi:hypothetical protein
VNGVFYVPALTPAPKSLKVELLFDNPNIEGDQTGGTSPYGNLTHWPDGNVDAKDYNLVSGKYGTSEGDLDWEYAADVDLDRTIDAKDTNRVSINYGQVGTYITDLSGLTVTFDTGDTVELIEGWGNIPDGALSFTLYKNGVAIGGLITFWSDPVELTITVDKSTGYVNDPFNFSGAFKTGQGAVGLSSVRLVRDTVDVGGDITLPDGTYNVKWIADIAGSHSFHTQAFYPVIRPVMTVDLLNATWFPTQEKVYYAAGRFWIFICDGTYIQVVTSTDGTSWSVTDTVRAASTGWQFAATFRGNEVHYVWTDENTQILYRWGILNADGTIFWQIAETQIAAQKMRWPSICLDSNGNVWIGACMFVDTEQTPVVISNITGVWEITQLTTATGSLWKVIPVALTNGKVYVIYAADYAPVKGKLWNGSSWESEEQVTTSNSDKGFSCAVADGDDVHYVTLIYYTPFMFKYVKRTFGADPPWSTETTVTSSVSLNSTPNLILDEDGDLYVFWASYERAAVFYRRRSADGVWDLEETWIEDSELTVDTEEINVSVFRRKYDGRLCVIWMSGTAAPYTIKAYCS